jgi:hypothetical protein
MKIHTLVIDCDGRQRNSSHFTIEESVAAAKLLRPQKVCSAKPGRCDLSLQSLSFASDAQQHRQVYCVGMSCSLGMHDAVCAELASDADLRMTLAHDGLTIGPWSAGTRFNFVHS